MTLSTQLDTLDLVFAKYEKGLNGLDHIPIVSTGSGILRMLASKIMVAVFAILAIVFFIGSLIAHQEEYKMGALRCFHYVGHGLANQLRGSIALLPLINLALIPYDNKYRLFYPAEFLRTSQPN